MNLHQIVSGNIAAVNPFQPAMLQLSDGSTTSADGSRTPRYSIYGGAVFNGFINGNVLTVTGVIGGVLAVGQSVIGTGVVIGTRIIALGSGTGGGGTYTVSGSQTVVSSRMSATSISAQVQDLSTNDLRQIEALNLQGSMKSIYLNGELNGIVRVHEKGGDLIRLQNGDLYLTTRVAEQWPDWVKVIATLQDEEADEQITSPSLNFSISTNSMYLPLGF